MWNITTSELFPKVEPHEVVLRWGGDPADFEYSDDAIDLGEIVIPSPEAAMPRIVPTNRIIVEYNKGDSFYTLDDMESQMIFGSTKARKFVFPKITQQVRAEKAAWAIFRHLEA